MIRSAMIAEDLGDDSSDRIESDPMITSEWWPLRLQCEISFSYHQVQTVITVSRGQVSNSGPGTIGEVLNDSN
eukprot:751320-Hanusia_phi.AAC.2